MTIAPQQGLNHNYHDQQQQHVFFLFFFFFFFYSTNYSSQINFKRLPPVVWRHRNIPWWTVTLTCPNHHQNKGDKVGNDEGEPWYVFFNVFFLLSTDDYTRENNMSEALSRKNELFWSIWWWDQWLKDWFLSQSMFDCLITVDRNISLLSEFGFKYLCIQQRR